MLHTRNHADYRSVEAQRGRSVCQSLIEKLELEATSKTDTRRSCDVNDDMMEKSFRLLLAPVNPARRPSLRRARLASPSVLW